MRALLTLIESDPRPTLLVGAGRSVVASNRSARRVIPGLRGGVDLASLCMGDAATLDAFLQRCAATRGPLPGALTFGEAQTWHVDGGVVEPAAPGKPPLVVLRLRSGAEAHAGFAALTGKIAELHNELHARRRLQAQLEDALATQEILLQEVHHRVKNNMQVVTSMLSLALGSRDPRQALVQAVERVRAIATVHELLYSRPSFTQVDGETLLRAIAESLATMHRRPEVVIVVHETAVSAPAEQATPLALIVTELVSNAYKHAFEGRPGKIRIALQVDKGTAVLSVADDGTPFRAERKGMGLRIVEAFVKKLEGTLEFVRDPKCVRITFPAHGGAGAILSHQ
jgi:two-component sensor histidine kinase